MAAQQNRRAKKKAKLQPEPTIAQQIDRQCGGPGSPHLTTALRLMAYGTPEEKLAFFGESFRVSPGVRVEATKYLHARRHGRPAIVIDAAPQDKDHPEVRRVLIQNIYADVGGDETD